jgi:hypothetical protein
LAAVVLMALVVQGTGLDLLWIGSCDTPCQDARDSEDCSCERCLCCSHHRHVTLASELAAAPRALAAIGVLQVADPASSAQPDEIMHVPKTARALS